MAVASFDVARVRGLYPTLGGATAYLEGSLAALQPESVVRALIATLRSSPAQPGSQTERSRRAAFSMLQARGAIGDLVGAPGEHVVLGPSVGAMVMRFAALSARDWQLGDEVVVSRADSDLVVRGWASATRSAAGVLRWAEVDLEDGSLPASQYDRLISRRTRVVSVPLGNPVTGAIPDVRAIADLAHRHGALVFVDASAALPHLPVDLSELGADLIGISAAGFGGPTIAALAAGPGVFDVLPEDPRLPPDRRFDLGPLPVELVDGVTAAVDHLAGLHERATARAASGSTPRCGRHRPRVLPLGPARRRPAHPAGGDRVGCDRGPAADDRIHRGRSRPRRRRPLPARAGMSVWTGPTSSSELLRAFGADELGGAFSSG